MLALTSMSSLHQPISHISELPELTGQAVHYWFVPLTCVESSLESLQTLLSSDERERAGRYRFPIHCRRFIVRHAALRTILAAYSGVPVYNLSFQVDHYGKPELDASFVDSPLYFNLSHSDELAVIAVSRIGPLGVDIERIRPLSDLEAIATQYFSPAEQAAILRLPAEQRLLAFYRCWTSKEAFIKALGMGLQFELNRFDVSVSPTDPPALLCIDNNPRKARLWYMTDVACEEGYMGAFVSTRRPEEVLYRRWVPPPLASL
ncbi:MAG: 4'-phosphopantetheinyl transferase superfamily protein [Candidatus Binatia bacterium]